MSIKGYYFITDSSLSRAGNFRDVKAAVRAGVTVVQYREKSASSRQMYEEAKKLRQICKNITFLVNDRIDIALAVNADGVHIGQRDVPFGIVRSLLGKKKIIGVTTHTLKEALTAQQQGADYLSVSPIFRTSTKKDAGPAGGVTLIKKIRRRVTLPIVAIGGINLSNAQEVIAAGADALCAISAVVTKKNVTKEIIKFHNFFR
jgi:thiamine-phosphate pyrophosphorylase